MSKSHHRAQGQGTPKNSSYLNETYALHYGLGQFRDPARIEFQLVTSEDDPDQSIVIAFHNAQSHVLETLPTVLNMSCGSTELLLVLDACTDSTQEMILGLINSSSFQETTIFTRVLLVVQPTPVWETSSENIGYRLSRATKAIISVQADMLVQEVCFNLAMYIPLRVFNDVFAVSARCAHGNSRAGRCGVKYNDPLPVHQHCDAKKSLAVRGTCNRGPLLWHAPSLRQLGFLDEDGFYQGDDDHDLIARAYSKLRMVAGYYFVDTYGPMRWGATRNPAPLSPPALAYRDMRLAARRRRAPVRYPRVSQTRLMLFLKVIFLPVWTDVWEQTADFVSEFQSNRSIALVAIDFGLERVWHRRIAGYEKILTVVRDDRGRVSDCRLLLHYLTRWKYVVSAGEFFMLCPHSTNATRSDPLLRLPGSAAC
ncbi:hypothetical protein GUITHDRAFT_119407 [Guillardia theta CCMP2712]|uniref:Glycosyltransferase 2-like domain-containing protein n=1 Tax=Guillardia theta (strain CCMP2712) TaxID=905079 RepID=L1IEX8_GUITC|nr:hypothetical protein GUITHDRAFT_119407 [Guillardia theta CCMP2712]EKX34405.1 hypothetical protein GUITHDRAFT_119407 [Guillardia theta CCMP2712]|eukprot:XP_005821385.1 hypothetical protein GUITHDRAFT_119407 [Guillardia theta CCMP2712]